MNNSTKQILISVEVPKGSFIKYSRDHQVEYISPIPCPFNYGSILGTTSSDGEEIDAVILGPRLPRRHQHAHTVQGRVGFIDKGCVDDKWICHTEPITPGQKRRILRFFYRYALIKRIWNFLGGHQGRTACLGWSDASAFSPVEFQAD